MSMSFHNVTIAFARGKGAILVLFVEYSIGDVKKDPLLSKLAMIVKEEKHAKEVIRARLLESNRRKRFICCESSYRMHSNGSTLNSDWYKSQSVLGWKVQETRTVEIR